LLRKRASSIFLASMLRPLVSHARFARLPRILASRACFASLLCSCLSLRAETRVSLDPVLTTNNFRGGLSSLLRKLAPQACCASLLRKSASRTCLASLLRMTASQAYFAGLRRELAWQSCSFLSFRRKRGSLWNMFYQLTSPAKGWSTLSSLLYRLYVASLLRRLASQACSASFLHTLSSQACLAGLLCELDPQACFAAS
jgi:hypothetical protein